VTAPVSSKLKYIVNVQFPLKRRPVLNMLRISTFMLLVIPYSAKTGEAPLCCPQGMAIVMKEGELKCEKFGDKTESMSFTHEIFSCPDNKELVEVDMLFEPGYEMWLNNSKLHINWTEYVEIFEDGNYCQTIRNKSETTLNNEEDISIMMVCYTYDSDPLEFTDNYYSISVFISVLLLLLTLVVYCLLKTLRQNLFGKLTMGFLLNSLLAFLCLGIKNIIDITTLESVLESTGCKVLGYLTQYFFIAFFCWSTCMSVSIARTFSSPVVSPFAGSQRLSHKRSLLFCTIVCQCIPLAVSLVTLALDNSSQFTGIRPKMGTTACFLGGEWDPDTYFIFTSMFLYFFMIQCLLLGINFICFLITGFSLLKHWTQVQNLGKNSKDKLITKLSIALKLFFIMGVSWVFDIISAWLEHTGMYSATLIIALDTLNLLTGVPIFIALVAKPKLLKQLRQSLCPSSSNESMKSTTLSRVHTSKEIIKTSETSAMTQANNGAVKHGKHENDVHSEYAENVSKLKMNSNSIGP